MREEHSELKETCILRFAPLFAQVPAVLLLASHGPYSTLPGFQPQNLVADSGSKQLIAKYVPWTTSTQPSVKPTYDSRSWPFTALRGGWRGAIAKSQSCHTPYSLTLPGVYPPLPKITPHSRRNVLRHIHCPPHIYRYLNNTKVY